jgi:hypothetical protein
MGDRELARRQYREIDVQIAGDHEAEQLVKKLEEAYDAEQPTAPPDAAAPPQAPLSPEIERFLRELGERLDT